MQRENAVQHVFLVGAKSLGAYGGYETFVYKLTEYHQNKKNIKYPDLYNEAVNIYGVDELYQGQENRMMYDRVKKYVMSNVLQEKFTEQNIKNFIAKYKLSEQLKEYSMEQIKKSLKKEIEDYLFDEWVDDIKKEVNIVYY